MGMFDNIICNHPSLPKEAIGISFQTKDLESILADYEITAEGRLVKHDCEWEEVPDNELPYPDRPWIGCVRKQEGSLKIVDLNYHGDIRFYGDKNTGELMKINLKTGIDELHPGPEPEWFEFVARFTDGTLVRLSRIEKE